MDMACYLRYHRKKSAVRLEKYKCNLYLVLSLYQTCGEIETTVLSTVFTNNL